uniref:Uncharacterized protein n=1 Tax=Rhizophora mucronata TaxID=61149 RepID=A0A2P2P4M9_RHIMU
MHGKATDKSPFFLISSQAQLCLKPKGPSDCKT